MSKTFDFKNLSDEDLDYIFKPVQDLFTKFTPRRHQYISLAFGNEVDRLVYAHGIGTGKTLCAIWTMLLWEVKKTLVVCPGSAFEAWERDISGHTNLSYKFLMGSSEVRKEDVKADEDVFIINYEGLKCLFGNLVRKKISEDGTITPGGWKVDYDSLNRFSFDCVVVDEIHRASSFMAKQIEICHELSWRAKKFIGLTGSLVNKRTIDKNLLDLWSVLKVVDLGKTLGNNVHRYRNAYFRKRGFDWELKPGSAKKILSRLENVCIRFDKRECLDLPPVTRVVRKVDMTKSQRDLEKVAIDEISKDGISITNALVKSAKLRQIASGFMYKKGRNEREVIRCKTNKTKELLLLLDEMEGKVIIFFEFVEEGVIIQELLQKHRIRYVRIQGNVKEEDRIANSKLFVENEDIRVMLCMERCAKESWHWAVSHNEIFYTQSYKHLTREQCEGRVDRDGQEEPCLIVDLAVRGSVEEVPLRSRKDEKKAAEEVLNYIKEKGGRIVDS